MYVCNLLKLGKTNNLVAQGIAGRNGVAFDYYEGSFGKDIKKIKPKKNINEKMSESSQQSINKIKNEWLKKASDNSCQKLNGRFKFNFSDVMNGRNFFKF